MRNLKAARRDRADRIGMILVAAALGLISGLVFSMITGAL